MALNAIDYTKTQKGPVDVFFGCAVPAANAEITITSAGIPDATENPNAKRVGLSENGASVALSKTEEDEFFDEFEQPLNSTVSQTGMSIKIRAAQILDHDVLLAVTAGIGTSQTVTDKKKIQLGKATINNTGIVVVAPTRNDPSMFSVWHMYSGHNVSNPEIVLSRQTRAGVDLEFKGFAIPTRAAADRLGAIWWETA